MVVLGRTLQFIALALLPLSMFLELSNSLGRNFYVADMLGMLIFGVLMFVTGRLFEGLGRSSR